MRFRRLHAGRLGSHSPALIPNESVEKPTTATTLGAPAKPTGGQKHVPLKMGLAEIISLELEADDKTQKKPEEAKKAVVSPKSVSQHHDVLPRITPEPTILKATAQPAISKSSSVPQHPQGVSNVKAGPLLARIPANPLAVGAPGPMMAPHCMLVNAMREEQEALTLFLQQRQQHSNLQLEQIRRMQTAMFLYQQGPVPGGSLSYLESLLTGLPSSSPSAADFLPNMGCPGANKAAAVVAGASGASPSLLSLAPKRSMEMMRENSVKERPQEYKQLSKKAKPMTPRMAPPPVPARPKQHGEDDGNHSDTVEGGDPGGRRFRPYQYEQWTEKFQELCDFRKTKGHCQVPHTYRDNPPLARWVKRQRYQYKLKAEGKMTTMTDERVILLENIGFIWDSHAAAWAEKLQELKEYAKIRGDCNVPSTFPENPQLATWVKCQRRQYKLLRDHKTSNMTVERILELEKVGFVWEVRKTWEHTPHGMERLPPGMAAGAIR